MVSDRSFIQSQILEVDRLLQQLGDHPLMGRDLRARKEELEQELQSLPPTPRTPRTVLFFTGQPVLGSQGIDAEFAGKVLEPFIEMVKTQYAAAKHGQVGTRGPRRDESEARLLLTGLPRGSFGLELSQPEPQDLFSAEQLSEVLVRLTEVIRSAGQNDEAFAQAIEESSPRLLQRLKDFLKIVADSQADVRVVSGDLECSLPRTQVAQAFERVSGTETRDDTTRMAGTFRGATLDSGRFDFRTDAGDTISGRIADEVSDDSLNSMIGLTNTPCQATLRQTTITTRSGTTRTRYELLSLETRG